MNNNYNSNSTGELNVVNINEINNLTDLIIKFNNNRDNEKPIRILDVGSSHGKNSIIILNLIIDKIKSKLRNKIIEIFHNDLAQNDFTTLFNEINNSKESYMNKFKENNNDDEESATNIYSYGIGKSFLNKLVPNNSIDFIFSFHTIQWLPSFPINELLKHELDTYNKSIMLSLETSRLPYSSVIKGFGNDNKLFFSNYLTKVLLNRNDELKENGVLFCNFPCLEDNGNASPIGTNSFENVFQEFKQIFREMHNEGILEKDEISKMIMPVVFYSKKEYETAFENVDKKGLKLIKYYKSYTNWKDVIISKCDISNSCHQSNDEFASFYFESFHGFSGTVIKSAINGDNIRKETIFNDYKNRFIKKYKLNPQNYEASIIFLFCQFQKK